MPTFTKTILKPGTYWVNIITKDGKIVKRKRSFSAEKLKHYATQQAEMKKAGLLIPAPVKHDGSKPLTKSEKASDNNRGFWNSLSFIKDSLKGKIEVPLEEDAKRIGKTIKEVSPYIMDEYTDGTGKVWKDVIAHVALVTRPVQPSQDNFVPVDEKDSQTNKEGNQYAVALSDFISEDLEMADDSGSQNEPTASKANKNSPKPKGTGGTDGSLKPTMPESGCYGAKEAVEALKTVGLTLPDDTSVENLCERIVIASQAIAGSQDKEDLQDDENTTEQPRPIAMSQEDTDFILDSNPNSEEDSLMSNEPSLESLKSQNEKLLGLATSNAKKAIAGRIQNLISSGRLTKTKARELFEPELAGFAMSLDPETFEPQPSRIEAMLTALEATNPTAFLGNPLTSGNISEGRKKVEDALMSMFDEEERPDYTNGTGVAEEDSEALDKLVEQQLASSSY